MPIWYYDHSSNFQMGRVESIRVKSSRAVISHPPATKRIWHGLNWLANLTWPELTWPDHQRNPHKQIQYNSSQGSPQIYHKINSYTTRSLSSEACTVLVRPAHELYLWRWCVLWYCTPLFNMHVCVCTCIYPSFHIPTAPCPSWECIIIRSLQPPPPK